MNVRQVLPPDAIPSVDDPEFGTDYVGGDDEDVIVLDADPPRAYPTRYLNYHEIVNDRVPGLDPLGGDPPDGDGLPVAVTWCPLCGSAVVYDRRVEGRVLEFGVSGKLADDDLVMYDRQTDSEWKQSTGEAIAGPLDGERLTVLPAAVTTVAGFREANTDGLILSPPGGASEASGPGDDPEPIEYDDEPYREYFSGSGFGLAAHRGEGESEREWDHEDLGPKDVVLGVERDGEALGFHMDGVADAGGLVTADVGQGRVVVVTTPDGIFAYDDPGFELEPADDEVRRLRGDGTTWYPTTGESADGRRLRRVPARRLFAFTWRDDHGEDAFWRP